VVRLDKEADLLFGFLVEFLIAPRPQRRALAGRPIKFEPSGTKWPRVVLHFLH
jgi:hypothetical protein